MTIRARAVCLALLCLLIALLSDAGAVRTAAAQALVLCARTVIPSLFPFLTVSSMLVGAGFGTLAAPLLSELMTTLFRLPGEAGGALVLGVIGGYPVGAAAAAQLYLRGELTRDEARRLLTFCNNANPAFFISVLGAGVFRSVRTGVWLWLIHLLCALVTGLLFRGKKTSPRTTAPLPPAPPEPASVLFVRSVKDSASAMVCVCGFVTVFSVLCAPLAACGEAAPALTGLLELFSLTPLLRPDRGSAILASAAAGWGGACVLCQTAAVLEGSGLRVSIGAKAVQGCLCALLTALLSDFILP